jgi:hypothetical protein
MRPARIIALALATALPILFLAATVPAAATPATAVVPQFEPDDKEDLAKLVKQLQKLKADLAKLQKIAQAAREQGRPEVAQGAYRRLVRGKRKYATLEARAKALKARLHKAHEARDSRRTIAARRPIRTPPQQRRIAVQRARRMQAAARHARPARARQALAARRAAAVPRGDRLAVAERAYRERMHKLVKENAALEKRLKANHASMARLKKGYAAIRRAKAARARAAAGTKGRIQAGSRRPEAKVGGGGAVLNELRALRRDMHKLSRQMQALLALVHKAHGPDVKADHARKLQQQRKQKARKASRKKDHRKAAPRKKPKRSAVYDDHLSL